jgi:hypothetical protein
LPPPALRLFYEAVQPLEIESTNERGSTPYVTREHVERTADSDSDGTAGLLQMFGDK